MRGIAIVVFAVIVVVIGATTTASQVPTIQVYFDESLTLTNKPCQGVGVIDQCYVVVSSANDFFSDAIYRIVYPPEMTWVADNTGGTDDGTSPDGLWTFFWVWDGSVPVVVNTVTFQWECDFCPTLDIPVVTVESAPHEGGLGILTVSTGWKDALGLTSVVCAALPVEETTWGVVKALYSE
jgi:hypothetical protein